MSYMLSWSKVGWCPSQGERKTILSDCVWVLKRPLQNLKSARIVQWGNLHGKLLKECFFSPFLSKKVLSFKKKFLDFCFQQYQYFLTCSPITFSHLKIISDLYTETSFVLPKMHFINPSVCLKASIRWINHYTCRNKEPFRLDASEFLKNPGEMFLVTDND